MRTVQSATKIYRYSNGLMRGCILACLLAHCMLQAANYFIAKLKVLPLFVKPALTLGVLIMLITLLA